MNQHLQNIIKAIEQNEKFSAEEKAILIKSAKDADKELEITAFKLDRTEKVKRTTAVLLEETIAELEQKRKAVEEQNKELEIEAAMERVRSRTMAMHTSNELSEVSALLYKELQGLGVSRFINCGYVEIDEAANIQHAWMTIADGSGVNAIRLPLTGDQVFDERYDAWKRKEKIFHQSVAGDLLKNHIEFGTQHYRKTEIDEMVRTRFVDPTIFYCSNFSHGYLHIVTDTLLANEAESLLIRFTRVFEMTYKRFLDLQKAEAQGREAEIQLALERVRARSLAMHKSEELSSVASVLFHQLQDLNLPSLRRCLIGIIDEKKGKLQSWHTSLQGDSTHKVLEYPLNEHPVIKAKVNGWKKEKPFSITLPPKELKDFINYIVKHGFEYQKGEKHATTLIQNHVPFRHGYLEVATNEPVHENEIELLQRFANVFDQAYTRFLDLQKAEAQARESQIQLALERVRARTMAMHHSDEITDLVKLLYQEFDTLKINNESTDIEIGLIDEDTGIASVWAHLYLSDGTISTFNFPIAQFEGTADEFKKWKATPAENRNELFFTSDFSGEQWEKLIKKSTEFPELAKVLQPLIESKVTRWVTHNAYFSHGMLTLQGTEPYSAETQQIQKRFTKVFEQTYTRFLDLQKAEAQAREAEIQLALERVRARTMAMHKSEELAEVAAVLFQQLNVLGNSPERINIGIVKEEKGIIEYWATEQDGNQINHSFNATIEEPTTIAKVYAGWKQNKRSMAVDLTGDELKAWMNYLLKELKMPFKEELLHIRRVHTIAFFSQGMLLISTPEPVPGETINLLERFADVFNLTYRRFLDLQKAEAQATEARIEAALEKVRSRSLAMHKAGELGEVAAVVFEKLRELDLPVNDGVAIVTHIEGSKDQVEWMENPGMPSAMKFFQPYYEHPILVDYWNAKNDGLDFIAPKYTAEQSRSFFKHIFDDTDYKYTPQKIKDYCLAAETYSYFAAFQKNSSIFINDYSGKTLIDEQIQIVKRFSKVFEQAYVRFLDLQKAEAQAREASIEAALERVRSKTMAMHNSQDVGDTVATMFDELVKLGVETIRCGIGIMKDDYQMELWTAKSEESGGVKLIIGSIDMKIHPLLTGVYESWLKRESHYSYELKDEDLIAYYTAINNQPAYPIQYDINSLPSQVFQNTCGFNEGALFAFTLHQITAEGLQIFKRFAGVFGQTYRRYLDLQKAEAQAREAEIQLALERVRARTMAMQKSHELREVVGELFHQMQSLGIEIQMFVIFIFKPDGGMEWWGTEFSDKGLPQSYDIPSLEEFTNHSRARNLLEIRKSKTAYQVFELSGKEKKNWDQFLLERTGLEHLPAHIKNGMRSLDKIVLCDSVCEHGILEVAGQVALSVEHENILQRFSKVFEQTYTRFLDVQKAEIQAKEAQIEASLERVRARTMAMHKSDELTEVATLIHKELRKLGYPDLFGVGYVKYDEENKIINGWLTDYEGKNQDPFILPLKGDPVLDDRYTAWKKLEPLLYQKVGGKELIAHFSFVMPGITSEQVRQTIEQRMGDPSHFYHSFFKHGALIIITNIPLGSDQQLLFQRFAKVFEQTFTRFLDLQKAEAQTKEAQIEAALERVRSRTMGMQHSDELKDAALLLFQQIQSLGTAQWACGFDIWDNDMKNSTVWIGSATGFHSPFKTDSSRDIFKPIYEAAQKGESLFIVEQSGKELEEHYNYMASIPVFKSSLLDDWERAGIPIPTFQIFHAAFFKQGYLIFISFEPIPAYHDIFKRFAKVFEQTYTRFLDLQKAEAQAKEAQIEASLERIRSRTMGMQKTDELKEIVALLYEESNKFGFSSVLMVLNTRREEDDGFNWWFSANEQTILPQSYFIPDLDEPVLRDIKSIWESGKPDGYIQMGGSIKIEHDRRLFSETGLRELPDHLKQMMRSYESVFISIANMKNGFIEVAANEFISEDRAKILQRYAKVFEQTYTRFLDLQKAEAQALEAIKRASVDRVRAEIASMRTTKDLERITPLIWNELTTLGVPFIRCGVFIMDEEKREVQTMLSTPDGKAIATLHIPFDFDLSVTKNGVTYWRKKEIYKEHWDRKAFTQSWNKLASLSGTSVETLHAHDSPESLYLHLLPFLQGMLYVGSDAPLNENELNLVQNLADAFSTAYARYEDFNKLEAAKKIVENTLSDLKQTQQQLVQSEKMASLGELTAGIAHEIQNPLNFVNNFSEVNQEMIDEATEEIDKGNYDEAKNILNDIKENSEKINHHGKRADGIVKGMLQHSRTSSGQKEPTDINALCDEYLRLAYHGLRAKDKSFNAKFETQFDDAVGKINVVPQDIGRVILNLINNAFYAVSEKAKKNVAEYEPSVTTSTKKINGKIEIIVKDNGNGIPDSIKEKVFQPFFTTKPTGQGTGLGLSLSYDIIKAHGGEIKVNTKESEGTEFIFQLPV